MPTLAERIRSVGASLPPETAAELAAIADDVHQMEATVDALVVAIDKVNAAADKRASVFKDQCRKVNEEHKLLSNKDIWDFYKYWTERSSGHRKHRWEKETSFDIKRRMERWAENNEKKRAQSPH